MPVYRLTYPGLIYATVEGKDLDQAKQTLVRALAEVQNGLIIKLDIDQPCSTDEVLYPDCDVRGNITPAKVGVED